MTSEKQKAIDEIVDNCNPAEVRAIAVVVALRTWNAAVEAAARTAMDFFITHGGNCSADDAIRELKK